MGRRASRSTVTVNDEFLQGAPRPCRVTGGGGGRRTNRQDGKFWASASGPRDIQAQNDSQTRCPSTVWQSGF
eukprot:358480-Chlamydomonas_euryale.AAC.9